MHTQLKLNVTKIYMTTTCSISYVLDFKCRDIPHTMGLPDHNPLGWQSLSVVVEFSSYPSSQTKQTVELAVVPL